MQYIQDGTVIMQVKAVYWGEPSLTWPVSACFLATEVTWFICCWAVGGREGVLELSESVSAGKHLLIPN